MQNTRYHYNSSYICTEIKNWRNLFIQVEDENEHDKPSTKVYIS